MTSRILVADDEFLFHKAMLRMFHEQALAKDYEFVFAKNGVEALKQIENGERFDLILTDIRMPEMDGLALLNQLNTKKVDAVAVIVTAYGDMPNIRKAMNEGAFDFLTKPVSGKDLARTIERSLQKSRLRKASQGSDSLRVKVGEEWKKPHSSTVLKMARELPNPQKAKIVNHLITSLEVEDLEEIAQNVDAQIHIARQNRAERERLEAVLDEDWQELIREVPLVAMENGYIEKRYSKRKLDNGEEKVCGPYYYLRWKEGSRLRGKLLGKEDPRSRAGFRSLNLKVTGEPED